MIADKFAPYPKDEDQVTADALARHMAVAGHVAWSRVFPTMQARDVAEGPDRANKDSAEAKAAQEIHHLTLVTAINEYAIAHLLRALQQYAPEQADEIAKDVWSTWEDGGAIGEWLWAWLTEYRLDPEAIRAAAEVQP